MVTSQFAISLALLSGSLFITKQLKYLSQKNLGFDRENVLVINHAEKLNSQLTSFRDELAKGPSIVQAAVTMDMPGRGSWEDLFKREGSTTKLAISQVKIDPHFFPTMDLQLAAGRAFELDRTIDHHHVVINETTARLFGWSNEEAIDQHIIYPEFEPFKIIGVVKDFHFQSLYNDIRPLTFFHIGSPMWGDQRVVAIKFEQQKLDEVLASIKPIWSKFSNGAPFEYSVFDEELARLYEQDEQLSTLVTLFSYLAIIIALLGLVGLISFTTEQKEKRNRHTQGVGSQPAFDIPTH